MHILNTLEKKIGHVAIPNLTRYLIFGQVAVYIVIYLIPSYSHLFALQGNLVLKGEWFRLFLFLFQPFFNAPIWIILAWFFAYTIGTALELIWGSFRYTLYLFIAYILTIACALIFPAQNFGSGYIYASSFLAFAYINPNFTLFLFFIIPIKIKWLAYLAWFGIITTIIREPIALKFITAVPVVNFLLFFGSDIFQSLIHKIIPLKNIVQKKEHYMQCATCGKTELDRKIFSYCHMCNPETQFCEDHIKTHAHKNKQPTTLRSGF